MVFGSSLPSSKQKTKTKYNVRVGPPQTKVSGSTRDSELAEFQLVNNVFDIHLRVLCTKLYQNSINAFKTHVETWIEFSKLIMLHQSNQGSDNVYPYTPHISLDIVRKRDEPINLRITGIYILHIFSIILEKSGFVCFFTEVSIFYIVFI